MEELVGEGEFDALLIESHLNEDVDDCGCRVLICQFFDIDEELVHLNYRLRLVISFIWLV